MKRSWLLVLLLLLSCSGFAQTDVLSAPTEQETAELKKLIDSYLSYVNTMSVPGNTESKKALSIKFIKETLAKGEVLTVNDLDSAASKKGIKIMTYAYQLSKVGGGSLKHSIDQASMVFGKMKYDQWRRFYYVEVQVKKEISWTDNSQKNKTDSVSNASDSSNISIEMKENPLSFFIRFEKENNLSKNFRIWSITYTGQMPELPPLQPLQLWWTGLDAEWKTMLNKVKKMEEYPRESDLERLTYQPELNLEKANFKTYEPLAAFTNVRKLILGGANINSFAPISKMTGLNYLDISRSQIHDITGVNKLAKLEELYCVGNQLTTIQPVDSLFNLLKFNCSENDLDDISPVKNLVNLKELNVSLNIRLKNIDAVKNLVNIEKLSFRKIEIKDLTPVQGMKNLVYLDCFNTGITSLEPIRNMGKIYHLDLSSNKVTSLEPIKNYQYIINLYLSYSSVSDLTVVDNFINLRELEIYGCPQITTLGGIHKFQYLKVLKCYYTKIGKDEIQRFKKNHPNCAITYY